VGSPRASVLIPTYNPGPGIDRVLGAVFAQQPGDNFDFEVVIVDSSSSPADVERMRAFPVRFEQIPKAEFGHGRTRNVLAELARGDMLLYMSQDAVPASQHWMRTLVEPLAEPAVAGAYARQIPRPNADPLIRFFLARTYGPRSVRRRVVHTDAVSIEDIFFSNVSSAIRRDVWKRFPFREGVVMSEDQYWACDVLRAGYEVVYQPRAQVYHSHNYSLRALFRRNWQSGASLRGLIGDSPSDIGRRGLSYVGGQAQFLVRNGRAYWLPYMLVYEGIKALGFSLGMRFGRQRA
jgi:rhamnosyltransferase